MDKASKNLFNKSDLKKYKSLSFWKACSMIAKELNYSDSILSVLMNDVDIMLHRFESLWREKRKDRKREVFFISERELKRIEKSTFINVDLTLLSDDFFSVAVDSSCDYPPFFVAFCEGSRVLDVNKRIIEDLDLPQWTPKITGYTPTEAKILIVAIAEKEIRHGKPGYAYSLEFHFDESIEKLIDAHSYEEWKSRSDFSDLTKAESLSEEERKRTWKLSRLAANMLMYRHVFKDKVNLGHPPVSARKTMGSNDFISMFAGDKSMHSEGGAIDVGYHMRCLKHEKFYRTDEWRDKPRGARWTPVNAHVKGGAATIKGISSL